MKSLIVLISLLVLAFVALPTPALTLEEAKAYIAAHPDQAAQDIVDWDTVQRSTLSFTFPDFAAIVQKDKSVDIVAASKLGISIGGGLLMYEVTWPSLHYPDLVKCTPGKWDWVRPAFWGCAAGIAIVGTAAILVSVFVHPMP
jgi:hypothetical protein